MHDGSIINPLRVASYNIRKARGLDGRRRPGRIVDVINGLDADVVVLQEADRRLGPRPAALTADLIAAETDFAVAPLAVNDISLGWHGNAVLVRRGRGIAEVARFDLPGLEPRGAVMVTLEGGVSVVGVHLGLTRGARRSQIASILHQIGAPRRTVIAGDMNEWSRHKGLEALQPGFTLVAPGRSFHAARPVAALDRIAVSRDLAVRDAGVDQRRLARIASDHLPVWADVADQPSL